VGNLLFVAGQLPFVDGELQMRGRLGEALSTADGASQSKVAVLNALAIAKDEIGSLEGLGVVNMLVLVASAQNYFDQHLVANEASELLVKVLGEQGKHTRTSVGVACLPFNGAVEVQVMFTVPP
jgi:enamine deaminase RidA (YjgF/YER057c/UK114 family)